MINVAVCPHIEIIRFNNQGYYVLCLPLYVLILLDNLIGQAVFLVLHLCQHCIDLWYNSCLKVFDICHLHFYVFGN